MAPQHSPFFQAQLGPRYNHSHSSSVTLSILELYDTASIREDPSASSAPTTPAAGPSTVQSPTRHRRTSSAAAESTTSTIRKSKQHRRNSAISKRSTTVPDPQSRVSPNFLDIGPAPPTAPSLRSARPPSLTLAPREEPQKLRRSGARFRVTNPSVASSSRRRTPAPSFVQPPSPPPPYSQYPTGSVRRVSVQIADSAPALPSSPFLTNLFSSSPIAQSPMFTIHQSGHISPAPMSRRVRPLPPPPQQVPRSPEPQELELELESDDLDRRPSLTHSESGVSSISATTPTESESIHPFDSDLDEEEDTPEISTPAKDEDESDLQTLHSFLEFSSCSSSSSSDTTGPLHLPRKFRTSIPVVGTFDPSSPEYSRGTFGAGLMKQYKRIVANGKTKLTRKRFGSTSSVESAGSSGSQDLDWGDALEGTLFG